MIAPNWRESPRAKLSGGGKACCEKLLSPIGIDAQPLPTQAWSGSISAAPASPKTSPAKPVSVAEFCPLLVMPRRSEERRVGKAGVGKCMSRGGPVNYKNKKKKKNVVYRSIMNKSQNKT